jgi:hypothetical protein
MKLRKLLVAGMCVASLGGAALPTVANAQVSVYVNSAPPAARYEAVPAARRGYIWVPGYWNARGNRHVWRAGHWERSRAGYSYMQPNWVERDNRWQLDRGRWNRGMLDRDGDGVPNNRDRAPNNPYRQ